MLRPVQPAGARGGDDLAGAYLLAGGTGYEIDGVDGATITVREYPFQACEEVVVPLVASMVRDDG